MHTSLNEIETVINAALVAREKQTAPLQRLCLLVLLFRDFFPKWNALTPDPAMVSSTKERTEVRARIGLPDMSSKRATILTAILGKVEVVVPRWVVCEDWIVRQGCDIDWCASQPQGSDGGQTCKTAATHLISTSRTSSP